MNKPITWNDLADIYDKHNSGRPARTLPMDCVLSWAQKQKGILKTCNEGYFYLKENNSGNKTKRKRGGGSPN